jgi:hypothetical protein
MLKYSAFVLSFPKFAFETISGRLESSLEFRGEEDAIRNGTIPIVSGAVSVFEPGETDLGGSERDGRKRD